MGGGLGNSGNAIDLFPYPDYGDDAVLIIKSWSSPSHDKAVWFVWQHFGLMALLCPWRNLESLAQRGMMDVKYWNPVFPFSDFLLKHFFSSSLTGVWKIRHLLRSVRCVGSKPAMGLVASLAPVQPQQSLREHINKSFFVGNGSLAVNVLKNQTDCASISPKFFCGRWIPS